MPKNTSIYVTDDLWERIEADRKDTHRTVSGWFSVAAREKLEREGRPEPPTVVKQYDENAEGRTR
jgi:hypothetical protein